jgi:hypothetical protein
MHKVLRLVVTIQTGTQHLEKQRQYMQAIENERNFCKNPVRIDRVDERFHACFENLRTFVHKVIHSFL